jgi:hypothetical protein
MPYTECTSLGSPTIVPTANPLRIYQELEAIDNVSSRETPYPKRQTRFNGILEKPLPPAPRDRRISVCSSFYSTDDTPIAQAQSWIDLSDDEDDEEITYPSYRREDIQPKATGLRRANTYCVSTKVPTIMKIEREIMEMLDINETEEDEVSVDVEGEAEKKKEVVRAEVEVEMADEVGFKSSRKSLSLGSLRSTRQSFGNLMGKLKKSLNLDDPPEWRQQIRPSYFNYMM